MTMTMIAAASQQKRSGRPFIIKVNYASGFTVTLPLYNVAGYNYNFIVDWGDGAVGQVTSATDGDRIHTYASGGTYTITMTGTLEGWTSNSSTQAYLVEVTQWGRTGFKWVTMGNNTRLAACYGKLDCTNMTSFGTSYATGLFWGCTSLTTVECSDWDTSTIVSMCGVFRGCKAITNSGIAGVSNWDVSNVIEFGRLDGATEHGMFMGCTSVTSLDLSAWTLNTTSNVTMRGMFWGCSNLTTLGDLSSWNTSKVTSLFYTFAGCSKLTSVSLGSWNLGNCINLAGAFSSCTLLTNLGDTSSLDVADVTTFDSMFAYCSNITEIKVTNWNMGNALSIRAMFSSCTKLATLNVSSWDVSKVTDFGSGWFGGAFYKCTSLTSLDVSSWNTGSGTSMIGVFAGCTGLTSIAVDNWDVADVTTFGNVQAGSFYHGMFDGCTGLTSLDLSGWVLNTTSNVTLFAICHNCTNLTTLGDLSGWNTSKVTSFAYSFSNCANLISVSLGSWNLGNCNALNHMFYNCIDLTDLGDTASLDVADVTTIAWCFWNCRSITEIKAANWNTGNITTMRAAFAFCISLSTLNVSGWNVSKVTDFGLDYQNGMFFGCASLTSIDVSSWNTGSAIYMVGMFQGCTALSALNVSSWDVSKVTHFGTTSAGAQFGIIMGCTSLVTFNTGSWNTGAVINCQNAFCGCTSLTSSFTDTKWWNRSPGIATYVNCFTGSTNISNYASIPNNWKGL